MAPVSRSELLAASTILALGIGAAGYFASKTLYNSKVGVNTATVKGLAERRVEADRAFWTIRYTVSGTSKAEVPKLYQQSEVSQKRILDLLHQSGFVDSEITPGVVEIKKEDFRNKDQKLVEQTFVLSGSISVETTKVHLVSDVRAKLNKLIADGLEIENDPPTYYFTKLNEIKPDMLKEATANARLAADQFAQIAGVKVGGINAAEQGGFEVHDVGDEETDKGRIQKDVRVVTTVAFYLIE